MPTLANLAKYIRVERPFASLMPLMDWIVVREELEQTTKVGLILLNKDHARIGVVLKIGDRAAQAGIAVGERIVYTEWSGGRWAFPDPDAPGGELRVLILEAADVEARLCECDHPAGCACGGAELTEIAPEERRPYLAAVSP